MNWSVEVLANLLRRLSHLVRGARLVVLSRKDYECEEVRALAKAGVLDRVQFLSRPVEGITQMLAGDGVGSGELIHVGIGAALLPDGAAEALLASHRAGRAGCTILGGVPQEASVLVYRSDVGRYAASRSAARLARGEAHKPWPAQLIEAAELLGQPVVHLPLRHALGATAIQLPVSFDVATRPGAARFERAAREAGAWVALDESAGPRFEDDTAAPPGGNLLARWRGQLLRELREQSWPTAPRASAPASRRRILYVSYSVAFSGAEEALCKAIARLDRSRFSLHALLGADGTFAQRLRELGVDVVIAGMRFCDNSLESFRLLHRIFHELAPDIVHFNAFSGEPALVVAKAFSCKCVYHLRVSALPLQQVELLLQMDHVIAVSRYVQRLAIEAGVEERRLTTLYDPIDTDAFSPAPESARLAARRALGIDPAVCMILMVARFERRKRHDVLIRALASLADLSVQCVLAGESNGDLAYEEEIRSLAGLPAIAGRVLFHGFSHDVRALEHAADVAVLCSDEEPLGVFILECMALGVPVIASESSGVAEIIGGDSRAGLLVRDGDSEHLAECLRWMITHPAERAVLAREAREHCIGACGRGNPGMEDVYDAPRVDALAARYLIDKTGGSHDLRTADSHCARA